MNLDDNLVFIILQDLIWKKSLHDLFGFIKETVIVHRDYLYVFVNIIMECYQHIHAVRLLNRIFS